MLDTHLGWLNATRVVTHVTTRANHTEKLMRTLTWLAGTAGLLFTGSVLEAQRVAPTALERAWSAPRPAPAVAPQQRRSGAGPSVELMVGIATGDGPYDVGPFLGVSFGWDAAGLPIDFRFDPSLAFHSTGGRYDANLLILGLPAAIQYQFRNSQGGPTPYIMGGLGLYYSNVSIDSGSPFVDELDDSSLDLGIAIGGGVRFNERLGLEARVIDIDGFTTLPILLTIRF